MKSILFREIKTFFGSLTGYLVVAVFLLLCGLFLFVFEGEFNILNSGFADLGPFFTIAPWILLFLIPAVTMRLFADESRQGTLELLLTKPLGTRQIVIGKFLGALSLILLALLPALVYLWVIASYSLSPIDYGSAAGSFAGLIFLSAAYASIGLFTSSLTDNQIVAFILAVMGCFAFFYGFQGLSPMMGAYASAISSLGMEAHFESMSRGVIDTRDVIYFLTVTAVFLSLTSYKLQTIRFK